MSASTSGYLAVLGASFTSTVSSLTTSSAGLLELGVGTGLVRPSHAALATCYSVTLLSPQTQRTMAVIPSSSAPASLSSSSSARWRLVSSSATDSSEPEAVRRPGR